MPKSRVDKSRKDKKNKFKQKKKMSNLKAPEMKPFRQVPTWSSTESFDIQGVELEALYNFFNIFAPAFTSVQQIFARGVQSGKINIGYEYEDGTQIPTEEVDAYTQKLNEYFKQKTAENEAKNGSSDTPSAKIVNLHGVPASEDNVSLDN